MTFIEGYICRLLIYSVILLTHYICNAIGRYLNQTSLLIPYNMAAIKDTLTNITPAEYAVIDYSQLGATSRGKQSRSFTVTNDPASTDSSIPVRIGGMLGWGGIPNDAGTKIKDYNSLNFKTNVSAIDYDTTSLVSSDGVIGVGTIQAFSMYTCFTPVYVFEMTLVSDDTEQLNASVQYNYIKPDLKIIQANNFVAAETMKNRPPSGDGNVNIWMEDDLGELILSPVNYLEFTSFDGKDFTLTLTLAAVAMIGQFKLL